MIGIVIHPFDRIFMHEPAGPQQSFVRTYRGQRECNYMVATKMVPAIGLGPDRKAGCFGLLKRPDQPLAGKLSVNRLSHSAVGQCQTRNAVPTAIRKLDQIMINAERLPFRTLCGQIIIGGCIFAKACRAEHADQFGMANIAMIAFAIILHHQFPIGVFDIIILHRDLETFEIIYRNLLSDIRLHTLNWRRRIGHTDEDQPTDIFQRNGVQAMVALGKIRFHATRSEKLSVQTIGPLMIGTCQPRRAAFLFQADFRAAVAATIPKCPHLIIAPAHNDDRIIGQFEHEKIARIFHMCNGAGIEPD